MLLLFPHLVRVNGRLVLVGDGIKAPKRGKKMPAVKLLHQQSQSNTKPEYIMGHSMRGLRSRKAEERPQDKGTTQDLWQKDKAEAVIANVKSMQQVASPVYGECNVTLCYRVCDLLWRPAGRLVRFVVVMHPTRGSCILMCTDTSLSAVDIIRLYGLRFKIEHSFKQATRQIGSFAYHFWMKDMIPLRYHNGNQFLHRKWADYRSRVKRKMRAYHTFIQAGVVAQDCSSISPSPLPSSLGLIGVLAANHSSRHPAIGVCRCKRPATALPDFLLGPAKSDSLTKFITERQDTQNMQIFRLAS